MNSFDRVASTSDRIKEAMEAAGKRQADIVRDTGIDKGALSRYIKGTYEPKQDVVYKLAKALNVSEMWLWGYNCRRDRVEEQKTKTDIAVDIVIRLGADKEFAECVEMLNTLDAKQLSSVKQMLSSFLQ